MNTDLLDLLRGANTPTVCNAIKVVEGKRGFSRFTCGTMICTAPGEPPIVGYAVTAKIAAMSPPREPADVIRARRMAYYRAMHDGPKPSVAVIEDVDYPDCIGAYWGEINTSVHKSFGRSGALTNGVVRDLGDLPSGFPVVAGSIGPSHGFVHVVSLGEPVTIFGLTVRQADLVHADRHGALVVPREAVGGRPRYDNTERSATERGHRPDPESCGIAVGSSPISITARIDRYQNDTITGGCRH